MNNSEITKKLYQIQELKRLAEEVSAEMETIIDEIKQVMLERDTDEMVIDIFKVRWTTVTTTRIDSASLKKAMPELYEQYSKTTSSRRFTIS